MKQQQMMMMTMISTPVNSNNPNPITLTSANSVSHDMLMMSNMASGDGDVSGRPYGLVDFDVISSCSTVNNPELNDPTCGTSSNSSYCEYPHHHHHYYASFPWAE